MNIWIDGYEANVLQRLGSSQVAFELLRNLEKIDYVNDYTILLPSSPLDDLPKERKGWKYKILRPRKLWTRIALPLALYSARKRADLFFSPTHYLPRFSPKGLKKVVTIFDLSFLHFPEMFTKRDLWQLTSGTKFSAGNADHVITISNFSKKDISKQYGIKERKITTAYPGYDREKFQVQSLDFPRDKSSKFQVEEVRKKYKVGDDYIIYIGTIQPRKNLVRLMEAFARVAGKLELVIVGKAGGEGRQGWMYDDILQTPKRLNIEERVKFLGYVATEDLPPLLSGALVYILPSLWEGFGIPVVEAMACGVPVIASNVSSLPEVIGGAGFLVDPYSLDQIEQAIRFVVTDKKIRQKYSKAGIEQAKKFSWDKMAKTVLAVFEKAVSS